MRKAFYLLGILEDVDIEWMATHGKVVHVRDGETLIMEKNPIDALYVLLEGEMSVSVGGVDGKHIAMLLPAEIVGEISFIDSRPPLASVVATKDSHVLAISREVLSGKLAADQGFANRFYRSIASFLADRLYVTVGRYGYGSAQQDVDVDELTDSTVHGIDLANVRFDQLLRRLSGQASAARAN